VDKLIKRWCFESTHTKDKVGIIEYRAGCHKE
jgi:hypothetical protein